MEEKDTARRREWVLAGGLYALFLFLAVIRHYLQGPGLFFQVIWDPVGIFSVYASDEFALRALHAGFLPLWDHTRGLGSPHVIPTGGNIDYPLRILAYLLDSRAGWELYILLRLWLAGIFTFIFVRELPGRLPGALFAGLAFMLCGYLREFQNLPDINVVLLVPLGLFLMIRLARRRRLINLLAIFLVTPLIDNSPESTFYACMMGIPFWCWLSWLQTRREGWRILPGLAILCLVGTIAAFTQNGDALWPFLEYWRHAWHFHPGILGRLHVPLNVAIGFVTPIFDYWLAAVPNLSLANLEQLTPLPAYVGLTTLALALTALLRPRRLSATALYFALWAVALAGVLFGVPPFSLLTRLPLIRFFQNFRYAQPFLALALAVLAGLGLDSLRERPARRLFAAIALVLSGGVAWHLVVFRAELLDSRLIRLAGGAAAVTAVIFGLALLLRRRLRPGRPLLAPALIAAAGLELALYFSLAGPVFGPMAHQFGKTPAVDFMNAAGGKPFRIYATDQRILHPNLAGIYGLSDLRDQTPLYLHPYVELFAAVNGLHSETEIMNHFLSDGRFFFDLDLTRTPQALLDLLNVRYLMCLHPPGKRPIAFEQKTLALLAPAANYLVPSSGEVGGVNRDWFLLHAPARLIVTLPITNDLSAEAGLLPRAASCPGADGAALVLYTRGEGPTRLAYARFLAPGESGSWRPFQVASGPDTLVYASLPGPRDNPRCDYALWTVPEAGRETRGAEVGLELVYDREYRVYENRDFLPRVFAPRRSERASGVAEVVHRLETADPREVVFLPAGLPGIGSEGAPAQIDDLRESPGRLEFRARAAGPAFAVISNIYFPGWRAWINGREARVLRADGLLQGLRLPPGESRVTLKYVPLSYRPFFWHHLLTLLIIFGLIFGLAGRSRRRRSRSSAAAVAD
jgi:hypothetical protein